MIEVTRDLLREQNLLVRAKAYFKKARERNWHVSATEVLRKIGARPPYSHLSPDAPTLHRAARACKMTYTMKRSILVFHPPVGRDKDNARKR